MRFDHGWDMPEVWRGVQLPRRGGQPFEVPTADPAATELLLSVLAASDLQDAKDAEYDPELLEEARRYAADLPRPGAPLSPRGAAAAAMMVADRIREWREFANDPEPMFALGWIARDGVVFAARAVAEMAGMMLHPLRAPEAFCRLPRQTGVPRAWRAGKDPVHLRRQDEDNAVFRTACLVRTHLAAADDATWAAAAEALRGYRSGPLPQRIAVSFVLPDQDDWIDEDIDAMPSWYARYPEPEQLMLPVLPALSATSAAQVQRHADVLAAFDEAEGRDFYHARLHALSSLGARPLIATLLDGLGSEAVHFLTAHRQYRAEVGLQLIFANAMNNTQLGYVLRIPADEAMRHVIRHTLEHRQADFQQIGVVSRDPERAMRLLAEPGLPPIAADLRGMHLLAVLPAEERALVGTRLAALLDGMEPGTADRKQVVTWLASIDTDEAFALLAARADRPLIRPLVVKAAARKPERALRMLTGDLLRDHVLARPDLVARMLPKLDEAARARVEAVLPPRVPSGPVAPESALPAALQAGVKARALPHWLVVPALPPVPLRTHDGAVLPETAVRRLLALLSLSTFAAPHPGLAEVREACDPAALTAFGWALFTQWARVEHPAADKQALVALTFLGDDTVLPRLTDEVLGWSEHATARARTGLEVFLTLGTDTALTCLQRMARTARTKSFRKLAAAKLDEMAQARGLTTAELNDRIVSDLGLDADGRFLLDYGPRRFTVTFDVKLNPLVADADGRRLAGLPRAAASDDAALADEAKRAFAALKRDARSLATDRIRALEEAMITGRSWSAAELRTLLIGHPAVRYLTRALLWQAADGPAFRVAEDGTLADVADTTVTLADDRRVTLYHPALAGPELATWVEVFADYEIFQPFRQLDREVHRPDAAQAAARTIALDTSEKREILYPLVTRGWSFTPEDGVERRWPGGFTTHITPFDVSVTWPTGATFGEIGAVAVSETLREAFRLNIR
ncbi:DUF4132 domain-containing protein [Catenuloplanes japonicus]|uniref:DUF4132 domain-containing protein n=1 Tax=Catenuloplanes japonicus TaxID=33876 RepID=UPI000A56AEB1|nr:DUF4132 domain-containing protein [Catenuloplanes japonicus]